jgi:uncharacterized protein YjiS (DUF1127 family)
MKPEYRTGVFTVTQAAAARVVSRRATVPDLLQRIAAYMGAWWRNHRQLREQRQRLEALASLDTRLLQDIGLSDELRSHALAQRESHYERFARTGSEPGGIGSRFGP